MWLEDHWLSGAGDEMLVLLVTVRDDQLLTARDLVASVLPEGDDEVQR